MAWRLAQSLVVLRDEVNTVAPRRDKHADGWIGDKYHRRRASRHNPNSEGVVTALDLTHDPGNGCDIHAVAEQVRRRPHPNLDYIISNGRIASQSTGWAWRNYTGSNKHRVHAHFAVGVGPDSAPRPPYDDTTPWGISRIPPHPPYPGSPLKRGMKNNPHVRLWQERIRARGWKIDVDGDFGPGTEGVVKKFQGEKGLEVDGIIGPQTWSAAWTAPVT
ncbi:MAG: peptidoglycan-binding protein [Actinomycetota bacterium]|nr:peptidoglycan-binding protein [Actinomycetota bacterium]